MARAELGGALDERFGFLMGASLKDFGHLHGGDHVGRQENTGYDELDGDLKFDFFISPEQKLTFAHQRVHQDDVPRTHKTDEVESWRDTTVGNERKRDLDQDRELTYLQYHASDLDGFAETVRACMSYQTQDEKQVRVRDDGRSDEQGVDVDTVGVSLQLESPSAVGRWTYGFEYYHDSVRSFRRNYNADGTPAGVETQGPVADDATYDRLGVYVQDDIPLWGDRVNLILGARYNFARADADKMEDPETGDRTSLSEDWDTVVGSVRALCRLDEGDHWHLFAGVSQGFRAPNLSDLTRLDTARTDEIETPSPDLDPEEFLCYEIGLKARYDSLSAQLAYFYTAIDDLIIRTPTGKVIGGDDEVTKKNSGDGYVHGAELGLSYRFHSQWTAFGSFCWMMGYVDTYPTAAQDKERDYLDRIQPATGMVGLRWDHPRANAWLELLATIADEQDKLSERDQADTSRIPPGGTPGYTVYTLRGGWELKEGLTASAAVENITDKDYRIHGSGVNEPGTNFVMTLDWRF